MLIQWKKTARVPLFLPREGYRVSLLKPTHPPDPLLLEKREG